MNKVGTKTEPLLVGRNIVVGYEDGPEVLSEVDVEVRRSQVLCIVGPNGIGKSTLLAVLAGVLAPRSGEVLIQGYNLNRLPNLKRAQIIGYLPQNIRPYASYTVRELVALGRYPHASGLGFETVRDQEAVERAMELTNVAHIKGRSIEAISGGERQRALIASVLASEPQVLLLDEPTAALDIGQRSAVFATLRALASQGAAVAAVTHDLNLAGLYADELVLLANCGVAAKGHPAQVICQEHLERAYGGGFMLVQRPDRNVPGVLPAGIEQAP